MSIFDVKVQKKKMHCGQCDEITDHERDDDKALWTCRDPGHKHPTREEQEGLTKNSDG